MKSTSLDRSRLNRNIGIKNKLLICIIFLIAASLEFNSTYSLAADTVVFRDIQGYWAQADIQKAAEMGYVKGYTDSTFRPDLAVTRAEFVLMLNTAFNVPMNGTDPGFTDVKSGDWFAADVWAAANATYIKGCPDNTFRPNDFMTREQSALTIFNLTKISGTNRKVFNDESKIAEWSKQAVDSLASAGIISGCTDGYFYPAKNVTRAQAVVMINKAIDYLSDSSADNTDTPQDSENINTTPTQVSLTVTANVVNIRSNYGISYPILGQVHIGDVLEATELSSNNWYKVQFGSTTGWITAQFVEEDSEISRGDIDRDDGSSNPGQTINGLTNYVWIWKLPQCEGGDIDALIQKAKELQIGYVIKTHDGGSWWQAQADAITKITAAGIPCGAWGYCYGNHLQDEINYVQDSFEAGASFYVADVESEYENENMRATAQQFMSAISKFGPVDYTSYAYPTYHSALPFDIFNQYARYAIPQVYWNYIGVSPETCFNRSVNEYKATGAKNIVPMGMLCNNVAIDEIKQFQELCKDNNYPAFWWDYQEASSEMLETLGLDISAQASTEIQ
jgi:hypothetical protein